MPRRRDLEGIGDPAFAVDQRQIITEWNTAAEKAFGYASEAVVGRHCHEILCGEDLHGNPFCRESCNIQRLVQRAVPVRSFVLSMRCAWGERKTVRMAVLPVRSRRGGAFRIVHLSLCVHSSADQSCTARSDSAPRSVPWSSQDAEHLTRTELEVLRQVALGLTTSGIAGTMGISPSTVRTHIRNLLRKLGAHTRAEALHTALRKGLLR